MTNRPYSSELNNNLEFPDGTRFYPDMKDGIRGYNTNAARGADTFIPFFSGITASKVSGMVKSTSNGGSPAVTYIIPSNGTYNFMFIGSNYHAANLNATKNGAILSLTKIYDYCPLYDGCIISIANLIKCSKGDKIVCSVGSAIGVDSNWTPQVAILPF